MYIIFCLWGTLWIADSYDYAPVEGLTDFDLIKLQELNEESAFFAEEEEHVSIFEAAGLGPWYRKAQLGFMFGVTAVSKEVRGLGARKGALWLLCLTWVWKLQRCVCAILRFCAQMYIMNEETFVAGCLGGFGLLLYLHGREPFLHWYEGEKATMLKFVPSTLREKNETCFRPNVCLTERLFVGTLIPCIAVYLFLYSVARCTKVVSHPFLSRRAVCVFVVV